MSRRQAEMVAKLLNDATTKLRGCRIAEEDQTIIIDAVSNFAATYATAMEPSRDLIDTPQYANITAGRLLKKEK